MLALIWLVATGVSGIVVWRSLGLAGSPGDVSSTPFTLQTGAPVTAAPVAIVATAPAITTTPAAPASAAPPTVVPVASPVTVAVAVPTPTPDPHVQTFELSGGTTAVSYAGGVVEVLWAAPEDGFTVEIEPEGAGWKVEFRSGAHRSRVDVWWDGALQHDVHERAD